jgi:hypothetical protein
MLCKIEVIIIKRNIIPHSSSLYFNTQQIISIKYKTISLVNILFFSAKRNSRYIVLGQWVINGTACRFYVVLGCSIQQRYFNRLLLKSDINKCSLRQNPLALCPCLVKIGSASKICIKFASSNRKNSLKMLFGLVCQTIFCTDCKCWTLI